MTSEALAPMIEALDLEVGAIREKGGAIQVGLRGGELVDETHDSWLYRFVVTEDLNLRDDTPVRVICGQNEVAGTLVSSREGMLIVALEEDLGSKIASARLVVDDSFLIERLKQRLDEVRKGEAKINCEAGDRVIGRGDIRSADAEPAREVLTGKDGLNRDQLIAVRRSLGSDTTFVWGPPGTGKTTTLARIVEGHYRAGRSVLIVSNTNIAVDTALEKVADRVVGEPEFHRGLVIRYGPVVKEELRQRYGPQVILEEIVARVGEVLQKEKGALLAKTAPLESEERSLEKARAELTRLAGARRGLADREGAVDDIRQRIEGRRREAETLRTRATRLRVDLERAQGMGAVQRLLSGLNPERLRRELIEAESSAVAADDAARALAGDLRELDGELVKLRRTVSELRDKVVAYPPLTEVETHLGALRVRLGELRKRLAEIESELGGLEKEVVGRCRILATTVYRTYLGSAAMKQFDVVVIDEASMLMPPLVYYAAGLAKESVTVAGDFRQLPPIVLSDEDLCALWLKRDVFDLARIPESLERGEDPDYLAPLSIQYRMREPICDIINDLFYDGRLSSDPSVAHDGVDFPLGRAPLMYVDTSRFQPWAALRVGTYSRYNLLHALLIRNIVAHLADVGYQSVEDDARAGIGVVSPYGAQAKLVQALLDDRLGPRTAGVAATVHRFQGNEKKAMVLDLTDAMGAKLSRFMRSVRREEDGARLLNVALSRARHHVVLLGSFHFLRTKAPANGIAQRLLDHFEEHGEPLDLEKVLPLGEKDWMDGLHRVFASDFEYPEDASGAFTEGTFYPIFTKDLLRAKESILILSPFATGTGTARWVDALRAAMSRGVRVHMMISPPGDWGGGGASEVRALVARLRDLGVIVDLRWKMHEKIAIIDGQVLWHGSLNILSHNSTHESMLRINSPQACQQVLRLVVRARRSETEDVDEGAPFNPPCRQCGAPTIWKRGRYGIYYECEGCGHRVNEARAWEAKQGGTEDGRPCPVSNCQGRLVRRRGPRGPFLGCSSYPACRHTERIPSN